MKISVVIPAYNEQDYLPQCLDSLSRQTRKPDEVIVVDNNCSDDTRHIAESYGARVISEKIQGIWSASATGYDSASGDVIARCDADSILPEDWISRIESHFKHDSTSMAITGPGVFYDGPWLLCRFADIAYMRAYFLTTGLALGKPPLFGSNFAMRTSAWRHASSKVHKIESIHDDMDLSYHLPPNITYEGNLRVMISARPLLQPVGMVRRYIKGFRSIFIHWPEDAPWNIYSDRKHEKTRPK